MTGNARGMYRVAGLLLSASAVRYAGQLVLLILIARFSGVSAVGTYTVALAVCAPVYILAGFGIRTVYLTLQREVGTRSYERFLLTSLGLAFAVIAAISAFLPPEIAHVLLVVAVIRTGETYLELYGAMLQRAGRPGTIVLVIAAGAFGQVMATGIVFASGGTLARALIASAVVYTLNMLLLARPVAVRSVRHTLEHSRAGRSPAAGGRPWRALLVAGLPTGVAIGMITLLSTVPQYLLGLGGDVAAAGRFAVLLYVVVAVEMMLHALAQSWIPHARVLLREGRLAPATVLRTGMRWTGIAGGTGLAGLGLTAVALPAVLGPEFTVTVQLAIPLCCAVLLVPAVFAADTAIVVRNRYALSMTVSVCALVVGTALGFSLVAAGILDLPAALWTFAVTMAVRAVGGMTAMVLSARPSAPPPRAAVTPRRMRRLPLPRLPFPVPGHVRPSALRGALHRHWPLVPIALVATVSVAAGPRWSLGATAAVVLLCLLFLLRTGAAQLLVATAPLAFYVSIGGVLVNLAVSDAFLMLLLVRVLADPSCGEAFSRVTGLVRTALCVLTLLLGTAASTIMVRSGLGAPVDWTAFAADALKLVVVIGYFTVCLVIFRDLASRGDFRFLRVWALTAAIVGALGTVGAILFAAGVETGLTMDFRATGTFEDPNAFATYLIISVPLTLLARHLSGLRLLSWHLVPILAGIFASFSRGALVGLAAVLLVLCAVAFRDPVLRSLRFIALAAVAAATVLILDGAASSVFESSRGVGFGEDVRFRLWAAATEVWLHSPVFGVGMGQFVASSEDLLGSAGGVLAHNTFLSILAEGGAVGAALYLVLPALAAVRLLRFRDTVATLLLTAGVGAAVMAVSLNLQNFRPLWILVALSLALTAHSGPGTRAGPPARGSTALDPHGPSATRPRPTSEARMDMSWN